MFGPGRHNEPEPPLRLRADRSPAAGGLEEEDEEEDVNDGDRAGKADIDAPIAHRSPVESTVTLHAIRTAILLVYTHSMCHDRPS